MEESAVSVQFDVCRLTCVKLWPEEVAPGDDDFLHVAVAESENDDIDNTVDITQNPTVRAHQS